MSVKASQLPWFLQKPLAEPHQSQETSSHFKPWWGWSQFNLFSGQKAFLTSIWLSSRELSYSPLISGFIFTELTIIILFPPQSLWCQSTPSGLNPSFPYMAALLRDGKLSPWRLTRWLPIIHINSSSTRLLSISRNIAIMGIFKTDRWPGRNKLISRDQDIILFKS